MRRILAQKQIDMYVPIIFSAIVATARDFLLAKFRVGKLLEFVAVFVMLSVLGMVKNVTNVQGKTAKERGCVAVKKTEHDSSVGAQEGALRVQFMVKQRYRLVDVSSSRPTFREMSVRTLCGP